MGDPDTTDQCWASQTQLMSDGRQTAPVAHVQSMVEPEVVLWAAAASAVSSITIAARAQQQKRCDRPVCTHCVAVGSGHWVG